MFQKENKTINFLNPIVTSEDVLGNAYIWLFRIGKYLLLAVEIVVLIVFFARFILDKRNNDLTESINAKVELLSNEAWKQNSVRFENLQKLLIDAGTVRENQEMRSSDVSEILSGIPTSLVLSSFSMQGDQVSLHVTSSSLDIVNDYEFSLKQNPNYSDVTFNITKKSESYEVRVSFSINEE